MCGIAGFCDFSKQFGEETLRKMTDAIAHRGPDDAGYDIVPMDQCFVGLGHRRLSIIDLSPAGHQPMHFSSMSILFNGEIYNYAEIKHELTQKGYSFTSTSDTEVVLKAVHAWGHNAVKRFIGMFAFSILNRNDGTLSVYRDRTGTKPLYYWWNGTHFTFASELKCFHSYSPFAAEKQINDDALGLYLQYSYIPCPYTIFNDTHKLEPGHYLQLNLLTRTVEKQCYWDVIDSYNLPKLDISEKEAIDETERLLKSSFEYRMVADVPVGLFLSGGYDSTAVAALLQQNRTERIKSFTIGFGVEGFDEAPYARQIAEHIGTDHTEYYCTPKEASEIVNQLADVYDEPFADNSVVPTILVSKLAREQVKVVLSGDGGDEIFAGYNKFNQAVRFTEAIPTWVQLLLYRSMSLIKPRQLPYVNRQYNFDTRYEKLKQIWASGEAVEAMKVISQYIPEIEARKLLKKDFATRQTYFDIANKLNDYNDEINKMLAVDYKTFLMDNNLVKVDRATMSVSLEGREPFLDQRLIEFVSRLPSEHKIKKGINKYLLKEVVHRYVDRSMMERPKMPFIAPLTVWFKDEMKDMLLDHLSEERLRQDGIFEIGPVLELRDKYLRGEKVTHQKLWNLLVFQLWKEKWF